MGLDIPLIVLNAVKNRSSAKCNFNVGDNVQLKSGGELMRVIEIVKSSSLKQPHVWCKWYEPCTKETRVNVFHPSSLKLFEWQKL